MQRPRFQTRLALGLLLLSASVAIGDSTTFTPRPLAETWALEISAADVEQNARFYQRAFGFEIERIGKQSAQLQLDGMHLIISHGTNAAREPLSGTYPNLMVKDLGEALKRVRDAGGSIDDETPQPFALGTLLVARDLAGNRVHLLLIPNKMDYRKTHTAVFNVSIIVDDMTAAEEFYTALGFEVFSRDWLPETLPLMNCGGFSLVLHTRNDAKLRNRTNALVLTTSDLETFRHKIANTDEVELPREWSASSDTMLTLTDAVGARIKIIAQTAAALASEKTP